MQYSWQNPTLNSVQDDILTVCGNHFNTNIFRGQIVGFLNMKPSGTHRNHRALED